MLGDSNLHKKGKGNLSDMLVGDNVHILVLRESTMRRILFILRSVKDSDVRTSR
jgi:hypothetical protein